MVWTADGLDRMAGWGGTGTPGSRPSWVDGIAPGLSSGPGALPWPGGDSITIVDTPLRRKPEPADLEAAGGP